MNKVAWLECQITRGMFPGEVSIQSHIAGASGDELISLFASESDVKHENDRSYLKVKVIDKTQDYSLVSLPNPSFEELSFVKVENNKLLEAAG